VPTGGPSMERTAPPLPGQPILVASRGVLLEGDMLVPPRARGLVLFAHGSGSGRHSPRNRFVARTLERAGLGTLLFDLLTPAEEAVDVQTRHLRFDIELLAERLADAARWTSEAASTRHLRLGFFGASTGAAAALVAAATLGERVGAVVSRGGRPDLAGPALRAVRAPTLLIVGGYDGLVVDLNAEAYTSLSGERKLEIVQGATHLFEEPGALEEVARLASEWFVRHLGAPKPLDDVEP
jgi:putative phosphoribosyl transferase